MTVALILVAFALAAAASYAAHRFASERAGRLRAEERVRSLTTILGAANEARTALERTVESLQHERAALDRVPCTTCGTRFERAFTQALGDSK